MPAPNLPIRVGAIGLSTSGGWATTLLAPILDSTSPVFQKYKLVALSTRSAESASATAEKYSAQLGHSIKAYHGASGTRDLAQDPDVDLVIVTVKVVDHKAAAFPAIEAGKDVFVEWPLGKSLEEAVEIAQKAKAKGVRAMVGTQAIHTPVVKKFKEVVESGAIGKVLSTYMTVIIPKDNGFMGGDTISERVTYMLAPNSGATHNDIIGGHLISGLVSALGPISSLSSTLTSLYPTLELLDNSGKRTGKTVTRHNPDQVAFTGLLASGATASFQLTTGVTPAAKGHNNFRWTVNGEKGTIEATGDSVLYTMAPNKITVNGESWEPDYEWNYLTGPIQRGWDEFAKGDEGKYATFEDAIKLHKIIDAVAVSGRDGVRVNIN